MKLTIITFLASAFVIAEAARTPELKYVSVVFRHGDRAPDSVEMYPNDPYHNNTFWPEGLGGLTIPGKQRLYRLGKWLRTRYNKFLGELYIPEAVTARSTDYKRTKMCLQLVLAALYPPKTVQVWNAQLNWQPIPTSYESPAKDWLMIPEECPEYLKERARVEGLAEIKGKIQGFGSFMKELTAWTGKNITEPIDMYNLYHLLTAEAAMNLTLPNWTKNIFPTGKLLDGINLEYEIFSKTTLMRRLNGGKLLHQITSEMNDVIKARRDRKAGRISLFSGHETNVAAVLQALGVYKPHVPAYASAVIFELYESVNAINNQYYVKIFYYLGIPFEVKEIEIPGCSKMCSLNTLLTLLRDVIPSKSELICDKSKKIVDFELSNDIAQ